MTQTLSDILAHFPGQTLEITPPLDPLKYVYAISPNHVAKAQGFYALLVNLEGKVHALRAEYCIADKLYDAGISVPKPEGVFLVSLNTSKSFDEEMKHRSVHETVPAFVMEWLKDTILVEEIKSSSEKEFAELLREKELSKARAIGFYSYDAHWHNALWDKEKEKVYLIDFERWRRI